MLMLALAIAAEPLPPRQLNDHMWTPDDFPRDALQKGESGRVSFVLDVNSEGRVTACTITASSGSSSLDETTCRLARRRARFEPARDDQGRPTSGSWSSQTMWQTNPAQLPGSPVSFRVDGERTSCEVRYNGARRLLREDICAQMISSLPKDFGGRQMKAYIEPSEEQLQPQQH